MRQVSVVMILLAGLGLALSLALDPAAGAPSTQSVDDDIRAACGTYNPYFAIAVQVPESEPGLSDDEPAVVAFTDSLVGEPGALVTLATHAQVGAVHGLAYDEARGHLYAAAYHKRGVYFGPGGPGQIYRIDLATGDVAPFVALDAGQDFHDRAWRNEDEDAIEFVGKVGLGDLEIDDDGTTLFAANALDGEIHRVSLPGGAVIGSFAHGATGEPWRRNARLFGLGFHDGWLYHGVVNSLESSSVGGDFVAVVYRSRSDGSEMTEAARFALEYTRIGLAGPGWSHWRSDAVARIQPRSPNAQPMLSDIEFTEDGNLVLGLRDRVTDMVTALPGASMAFGFGDVLSAVPDGSGWRVVAMPEHYADRSDVEEATWGGLAAFPGLDQVVASAAAPTGPSGVGALWFENDSGRSWRQESVYALRRIAGASGATGVGDVEALCARDEAASEPVQQTATAFVATATQGAWATQTAIATQGPIVYGTPMPLPPNYKAACEHDNPYLATVCYDSLDWLVTGYDWVVVYGFRDTPDDATSTAWARDHYWLASASDVGAIYGLAFRSQEDALYASAFHKRLVRFGPGGTGAIYRVPVGDTRGEPFVIVPDAGRDYHSGAARSDDVQARDHAGKVSLGDLEISADERELYVVNLNDRRIYRYAMPGGTLLGSFAHGAAGEPWADDARPFGLGVHDGKLYHGVVDSAESDQNRDSLTGYVYESGPDGADMRLVTSFPLTYERGVARVPGIIQNPGTHEISLNWLPWLDGNNDLLNAEAQMSLWPQPIVSDIAFTDAGDMAIGVRDRHADMGSAMQMRFPTHFEKPGLALGDTLRADFNGDTWDVAPQPSPSDYYYDRTTLADESTSGALARLLGLDRIVASALLGNPRQQTSPWTIAPAAVWYEDDGTRLKYETVCRLPAISTRRSIAAAADAVPVPGRPQHNEYVPARAMGDLEVLCGPTPTPPPPTPTATEGPSPTASPTSTRTTTPSPTPTPTPTATSRPGRIYVPIAVKDRKCDPSRQHVDVVLIIDASLTMTDPTRAGRPKIDAAREAARLFIERMKFPGDQAAIVSFNETATVNQILTGDTNALMAALDAIDNHEFTRIDLGLEAAHGLLLASERRGVNTPAIIMLTDGRSNPVPVGVALEAADAIKADGIALYTIGLGDDAEHAALKQMATSPEDYRYAPDGEDLGPIYEELAVEIPCPPSTWWPHRP